MHCALCAGILEEFRLLDPKRVGYVCIYGHSFFTWSEPFGRRPCVPEKVPPLAAGATDVEILRYWLTNPVAREQLVDLLALICERLIEVVESSADAGAEAHRGTSQGPETSEPRRLAEATLRQLAAEGRVVDLVRFCPTCGRPLSKYFDPRDSYVDGLICAAKHDFSYRGWTLWFMEGGGKFELWFFPVDTWLASTADDALSPSSEHWSIWKGLVHPQLRAALSRLRCHLP
jgi:hypothetical protein